MVYLNTKESPNNDGKEEICLTDLESLKLPVASVIESNNLLLPQVLKTSCDLNRYTFVSNPPHYECVPLSQ